MKRFLSLAGALILAAASAQALTIRTITGRVINPSGGNAITAGKVVATPYGTMPSDPTGGVLIPLSYTFPIVSGVLTCSAGCTIVSPANFTWQIYETVGYSNVLRWTFTAGVPEVAGATTLQAIYALSGGTITVPPGNLVGYQGVWSNVVAYSINNLVMDGGTTYICTAANTAIEPGVTSGWASYWTVMGSPGITNGAGANVIPKSNGTNLVTSGISDDGTTITLSETLSGTKLYAGDGTWDHPTIGFSATPALGFYKFDTSTIGMPPSMGISFGGYGGYGILITNSQLALSSLSPIQFAPGSAYATADAGITRPGVGVVRVTNGSTGFGTIDSGIAQVSTANGATAQRGSASELVTLNTGGTTTDTSANLLPANSNIESVVGYVTTTITTATDWKLGDATVAGRFTAAQSGGQLTVGAGVVGLVHIDQSGTSGPRQTSAAKVRITTTGTPGAGAIRVTVFYRTYAPATS